MTDLAALSASALARAVADGETTAEAAAAACLATIRADEPRVQAWHHLDAEAALERARAADRRRRAGRPRGPLDGVPVGVKDIFDTADMPTENGTPHHAGRRPARDATAVALLRRAGAVILGKTVTTELAVYAPGKTRNPHDPGRSPGGSSSGSAAAVAAGMVPLALGTQTNGSVIRPASYCGVFGYKPSFGLISRAGVLAQSAPLDHVGLFARRLDDLALAAGPLMAWDGADPGLSPDWPPTLDARAAEAPPKLALARTDAWEQADADLRAAFDGLAGRLGIPELDLGPEFAGAWEVHRTIMEADLARSFAAEYAKGVSPQLSAMIERGQAVSPEAYAAAVAEQRRLTALVSERLAPFDAVLTPATTGQAPIGLASTGSPVFCTLWTLTGAPALSLPVLTGADGLPIGVQAVAAPGDDARLFRAAAWVVAAA